eukprot:3181648-Ditylum_brightwellii.AAC.1
MQRKSAIGRHYINGHVEKKWSLQENSIVNSMVVSVDRKDKVSNGGGCFIVKCIFVSSYVQGDFNSKFSKDRGQICHSRHFAAHCDAHPVLNRHRGAVASCLRDKPCNIKIYTSIFLGIICMLVLLK